MTQPIIGTPPFFIQGLRENGVTYIAGFTNDATQAAIICDRLAHGVGVLNGYIEDKSTDEEAVAEIQHYDPFFKGDTIVYSCVSIRCYDDRSEYLSGK